MARIVLTTHGSSGELNPFIALGRRLRQHGHQVRFAMDERLCPVVAAAGFEVYSLPPARPVPRTAAQPGKSRLTPQLIQTVQTSFEQMTLPGLPDVIEALRAACATADLLVSHANQYAPLFVADLLDLPWASIVPMPIMIPSRAYAPYPLPGGVPAPLQPLLNRSGWLASMAQFRRFVDRPLNQLLARYGLPPRRDLFFTGKLSRQLTLAAFSTAFLPRPGDWPAYIQISGFCFWDKPETWREPAELTAFLETSGPVVAISSGSMSPLTPGFARFYETSIAAVRQSGARALVIGAPGNLQLNASSDDVYDTRSAPFSEVYPRCRAVIHHGGIGTIAQGLRAGVPALILPWGADQFFNGRLVENAGAGRVLRRERHDVDSGARELEKMIHQNPYAPPLRKIAEQLRAEDGAALAAQTLEATLAGYRRPYVQSRLVSNCI